MIAAGWQAAAAPPDACPEPSGLDGLDWLPARVPGTAAAALRDAGRWEPGDPLDFDAQDWWFRARVDGEAAGDGERVLLALDGVATVAEVWLDGERVLESESMFARHRVDVTGRLRPEAELAIRCRALRPLLGVRRKPRARWRTRVVADGGLRFFRTAIMGRAPGFAPGPAPVGPWRPVRLERRRGPWLDGIALRPRLEGDDGVLAARVRIGGAAPDAMELVLSGPSGEHGSPLALAPDGEGAVASGELRVPRVARWWPHTHGEPALHDVRLRVTDGDSTTEHDAGRVGFRTLASARHPVEDGLALEVNGVPVFARGAVWTPVDPVGLAPAPEEVRATLERVRDAGMNIVRVVGTAVYEDAAFHDLCDELGVLVWQDFMFANLDYPVGDDAFRTTVEREAAQVARDLAGRPSTTVLCGNSEVEQQVAMLGLDPALGRGELFGELLPAAASEAGCDAVYVPSSPCGGTLPFRPDRGVAHWFGVGAYRRPLDDARRAGVRFASECLAFANVPDEVPDVPVHHPAWKAGVPRDVGAGWDFDDVRDHYLRELYGVDPVELRWTDHERYLELSRAVTGEAMAEVFGEWRRPGSPCAGGIVLWLRDLRPGAGWGLLDHAGRPKAAWHHLRRALAPVAVWTTDEGLGGVAVHVANDRPEPLDATLRVALYRDGEVRVEEAAAELRLAPRSAETHDLEGLLGRFVDAAWSYRFGPPGHDAIVVSLERGGEPLSQAVRFPAGRPLAVQPAAALGLEAHVADGGDGGMALHLSARRLVWGVRVAAPGFAAADDAFCLEPGVPRTVSLSPERPTTEWSGGALRALNLAGGIMLRPLS